MNALEPTSPDQIDTSYIEYKFQTELKSSTDKLCDLDPMPTKLLEENAEVVAPCISDINNLSIKRVL